MMNTVIKKKKLFLAAVITLSVITAFLASGCSGEKDTVVYQEAEKGIYKQVDNSNTNYSDSQIDLSNRKEIMYAMQDMNREVAKEVLPIIVEVNVVQVIKQNVPGNFLSPWDFLNRDFPFGQAPNSDNNNNQQQPQQREYRKEGLGSGVIVGESGNEHYIITNKYFYSNTNST